MTTLKQHVKHHSGWSVAQQSYWRCDLFWRLFRGASWYSNCCFAESCSWWHPGVYPYSRSPNEQSFWRNLIPHLDHFVPVFSVCGWLFTSRVRFSWVTFKIGCWKGMTKAFGAIITKACKVQVLDLHCSKRWYTVDLWSLLRCWCNFFEQCRLPKALWLCWYRLKHCPWREVRKLLW